MPLAHTTSTCKMVDPMKCFHVRALSRRKLRTHIWLYYTPTKLELVPHKTQASIQPQLWSRDKKPSAKKRKKARHKEPGEVEMILQRRASSAANSTVRTFFQDMKDNNTAICERNAVQHVLAKKFVTSLHIADRAFSSYLLQEPLRTWNVVRKNGLLMKPHDHLSLDLYPRFPSFTVSTKARSSLILRIRFYYRAIYE
jgi:hypothetical protein